jgi:hypothetical protein
VGVDRRRHRDDEDVAAGEVRLVGGDRQPPRRGERLGRDLQRAVAAGPKLGGALGIEVEPHHLVLGGEGDGERQPHVAQAEHRDLRGRPGERVLQHRRLARGSNGAGSLARFAGGAEKRTPAEERAPRRRSRAKASAR